MNPTSTIIYSNSNPAPSIINCTANEPCSIYCQGKGCQYKYLNCPVNGECFVTCDTGSTYGCAFSSIHAENSLSLFVTNIGAGSRAFNSIDVYCPLDGPCDLLSNDAPETFSFVNIYNLLGFNRYSQFKVYCDRPTGANCAWGMRMRCGHQYSDERNCEFSGQYWNWCPTGRGTCLCTDFGRTLGCCASTVTPRDQFCNNVFMTLPISGEIWTDDFIFGPNVESVDYEGWFQLDWNENDISDKVFTSSTTNNKYHGPFVGDSNTAATDIEVNSLTRYFYCPYDSIIDINYDIIFACTTQSDYTLLKINDLEIINEKMNSFDNIQSESFSDNSLKINSINSQNCNNDPFRKSIFGYHLRTFPENTLNGMNEYIISGSDLI